MIIGITGPTGAGKSTVCDYISKKFGIRVINCDEYARRAVCPQMISELAAAFGKDVLQKNGELNRKALAAAAFASKEGTDLLNKITHPYIIALIKADIKEGETVILDAPTLFESGLYKICRKVVAVLSKSDLRANRIKQRDNLSQGDLEARQNAVKPDGYYLEKTDNVIYNEGSLEALYDRAAKIFTNLLEE